MFMENVFSYFSIALIKSPNHDSSQNEIFIWGLQFHDGRISVPNTAGNYCCAATVYGGRNSCVLISGKTCRKQREPIQDGGNIQDFKTFPHDILPPVRLYLLTLPKQTSSVDQAFKCRVQWEYHCTHSKYHIKR